MTHESEDVLKALSSSTRRTIMKQISEKGSATYTEIMQVLNLDPSLMSGKFNYHLKELSEVGLVEKENGGYKITDLGQRALILVDQVSKDAKVDSYGVLSAVISMSPKKELELFSNQIGLLLGLLFGTIGTIAALLTYETGGLEFLLSFILASSTVIFGLVSGAKMVGIITKYKLGFSSFLFLSSNWFLIRSRNRNNFFIISMLCAGFFVAITLTFVLPFSGEMILYSMQWYSLLSIVVGSGLLSVLFYNRAKKKADRLEEMANE